MHTSSKNPTIHEKTMASFGFIFDYYKKPLSFKQDSVYQLFISTHKHAVMYLAIHKQESEPIVLYNCPAIQYISVLNPPLKPTIALFLKKYDGK